MSYADQADPSFPGTFEAALDRLKNRRKVYRTGWNGKGMYVELQVPDPGSMNTLPYIFMITAQGERVPWVASHTDLLSKDWRILGN